MGRIWPGKDIFLLWSRLHDHLPGGQGRFWPSLCSYSHQKCAIKQWWIRRRPSIKFFDKLYDKVSKREKRYFGISSIAFSFHWKSQGISWFGLWSAIQTNSVKLARDRGGQKIHRHNRIYSSNQGCRSMLHWNKLLLWHWPLSRRDSLKGSKLLTWCSNMPMRPDKICSAIPNNQWRICKDFIQECSSRGPWLNLWRIGI